jgi:RES domain-containing protein
MLVYRLQKSEYAQNRKDILSGIGAKLYGGRWNPKGVPLIYTSATPELAHSEFMIHIKNLPPPSTNLVTIKIPEKEILDAEELPGNWRSYSNLSETQFFTHKWLSERKFMVLRVPSAIVPMSFNYLINPLHPKIDKVLVINSELFQFDERFLIENTVSVMKSTFEEMLKTIKKK